MIASDCLSCDTCRYFHSRPKEISVGGALMTVADGECRIHAPERDATDGGRGKWPLVMASDYCHCHALDAIAKGAQ